MGEISFSYQAKSEFKKVSLFRYNYSDINEYSLIYKRYIALSDASIFNGPVAITKVAAGLLNLRDLFVEKNAYINLQNRNINIKKQQKNTDINHYITTDKPAKNTIDNLTVFMHKKISNYYLSMLNSIISTKRNDLFFSIYENVQTELKNFYKYVIYTKSISLNKDFEFNAQQSYIFLNSYNYIDNAYKNYYQNLNKSHLSHTNIIPILFTSQETKNAYINKVIQTSTHKNIVNIYKEVHGKNTNNFILNIYKNFNSAKPTYQLNIYANMFANSSGKYVNIDNLVTIFLNNKYISKNDIQSIYIRNKDIIQNAQNIFGNIETKKNIINKGVICNVGINSVYENSSLMAYKYKNKMYVNNDMFVIKYTNNASYILHSLFANKPITDIYVNTLYKISKIQNLLCIFDIGTFSVSQKKYITVLNSVDGQTHTRDITYEYNNLYATKFNLNAAINTNTFISNNLKNVILNSDSIYAIKYDKQLHIDTLILSFDKYIKKAYVPNSVFMSKQNKKVLVNNTVNQGTKYKKESKVSTNVLFMYNLYKESSIISNNLYTNKLKKELDVDHEQVLFTKYNKSVTFFGFLLTADKLVKSIYQIQKELLVYKDKKSIVTQNLILSLYKDRKSFEIKDAIVETHKDRKSFKIKNSGLNIYKDRKSFEIKDIMLGIYKNSFDIPYPEKDNIRLLYKDEYDFTLFSNITAFKDTKNVSVWSYMNTLFKSYFKTSIDTDINDVIKTSFTADMLNSLNNSYGGMIIPISKVKLSGFTQYIDNFVMKTSAKAFIEKDVFTSVIPKDTNIPYINFTFDKEQAQIYIEYRQLHVYKKAFRAFLSNPIFAYKIPKNIFIDQSCWATGDSKEIFKETDVFVDKEKHFSSIYSQESLSANDKKANTLNQMFVDKDDKMCYYDYGISLNKEIHNAFIDSVIGIDKDNNNVFIYDFTHGIKKQLDAFYDFGIFETKDIQQTPLFQEQLDIIRTVNELGVRPDDFGNWAWVYEAPDPFDGITIGIDELLLPERDTRYKDFAKLIFNTETMEPRNPVKTINETTFIAKYPIKHPIPDYEETGIVYIDVRTEIMHKIYLKFYQIWQTKLFEFSTMSMTQSVTLMLKYIYAWIMSYFPDDEITEALRVLRQIRWFAESAIIQNSQYVISYEYDVLESKLTTGTCLIPNDIDGTTNDTMYVDGNLGVIRNTYWNCGVPAHVTFEINNKKNTIFSFSLSNTVGSVNIYINDVLVDTLTSSGINYSYDLLYTGEPNYVKIEKEASHNINNKFFIGNIKVPNANFKDLSISFDPSLKAGNKPLNEIAKKMVAFANLYDDRDEIYEQIRKANLGVNETFRMMEEYWKLHHQNKTKGKRLTIKEV